MSIFRTYLVTGATSGIGHALARRLASTGRSVLLGARTTESGQLAAERIRTDIPDASLSVVSGDLSEMTQVRALAEQVREAVPRLDGVVLNAAEVRTTRVITPDGFETNFATNYLSGFLLTELLMPLLKRSRPARIVTVSSSNHSHIKTIDLEGLATAPDFRHANSYSTSKLLNVLHATALAPLLTTSGVTINVADPGFVRTNLGRHATGGFALFLRMAGIFQDSPEKAVQTPYHLVTAPEFADTNGQYFTKGKPGKPSRLSRDAELASTLRDFSISLLIDNQLATSGEFLV
ncbi:SDR family NAD(P)-dependent oxidoreductase [Nakamurella aerolata]|uniref:SDR family NAD(P)-dependent oxidoreductase n=1 Tax=Nakamurella aerolata TaxID=1656892 RepID=A0A849A8Q8_9ACTN|nr:SDR family NAD(P)-dependent oxidoreductase [Nakamurella aerolata]NNG35488.1 SDR family NAD(P)-dependent oxidoreductase [Nakamurella aerolata]